ncbi:helix-turn-helix domain-containing protein [Methylorubrum populi]
MRPRSDHTAPLSGASDRGFRGFRGLSQPTRGNCQNDKSDSYGGRAETNPLKPLKPLSSLYPNGGERLRGGAQHTCAPRCLIPFDRQEGLTTAEAAQRANRTERTIRLWCRDHDIGRHVAGGPWLVSKVALAMFLNDDAAALRAYLSGDRQSEDVVRYFEMLGLGELVARSNRS